MKTKNYMVSLKDTKTGDVVAETFIHSIRRNQSEFMLRELYERWSPEYKRKPYRDNIELKFSTRMDEDLKKLISLFGNKISFGKIHFHLGQDESLYVCYPPRIKSFEESKNIISRWFLALYFHAKIGVDPNLLESFGNYLFMSQNNPISLFGEYTDWISEEYKIQVLVEEVDEIPEEPKFFGECGMKNKKELEDWKEEVQEYKEFELFFSIVDLNEKLFIYSQDYYDGKIKISLEEFNEKRNYYLDMQKSCLPMLSKFGVGVDPDSFLDRENGSYWKWYHFWKNWMEGFSDEAWHEFQLRLEKKESVEIYLPYVKWDK